MSFTLCVKSMTPLQRRALQQMCGAAVLAMLTNFSGPRVVNPLIDVFPGLAQFTAGREGHSSALAVGLIAAFSLLSVIWAVWVAGRYPQAEPDEFIRSLVIHALLWGFAGTMAGDAIVGALIMFYYRPLPLGQLNADLFVISTAVAFRLLHWSYR